MTQEPVQRFRNQMTVMITVANYLATLGASMPPIFALVKVKELPETERERWGSSVTDCAEFVTSLHPGRQLYVDEPDPTINVNPNCPALDFSDSLQAHLGKIHPLFDFIYAPFTRPLGTQFTLIFVTYTWDAYDTFTNEVLRICCAGTEGRKTDERLNAAEILPSDDEIAGKCGLLPDGRKMRAEEVSLFQLAAKLLRNSFSHHAADPLPRLRDLIEQSRFHSQLMRFTREGEFEVVPPMSRIIADVIRAKVELIQARADRLF